MIIVLSLLSNIASIAMVGFTPSDLFSIVLGLVIPVLYTAGTMQLKNQAA